MTKYDDVSWHVGGKFPSDLSEQNARTHIGIFLAWAIERGLAGERFLREFSSTLDEIVSRRAKGSKILQECCDDKITNDDFSPQGNLFAKEYYESGDYFRDYENVLGKNVRTLYYVEDSWENYELMKRCIESRFSEWRAHLQ